MIRFAAGLTLGVLLGCAIGAVGPARAAIGSYFVGSKEIYDKSTDFQRGYVTGVYDTAQVLGEIANARGGIKTDAMVSMARCLDGQGDTVTEFVAYASRALQNARPNVAAADPIMAACLK
jgi:hypothetical protein